MRLLFDLGHSRLKWALAEEELIESGAKAHGGDIAAALTALEPALRDRDVDCLWVSNVMGEAAAWEIATWAAKRDLETVFASSQAEALGVKNGYTEPAQLGVDRWLAVIGAWQIIKNTLCLVDFGTAITFDGVNADGQHLGGAIMPGLRLMRQSLIVGTTLEAAEDDEGFPFAHNTAAAMTSGALLAASAAVERFMGEMARRTGGEVVCMLTGGDAEEVTSHLPFEVMVEPRLVLIGLNSLAEAGIS